MSDDREQGGLGRIVELKKGALSDFLDTMRSAAERGDVYSLLFAMDEGGIKVKFNNQPWSMALGEEWKG